MKNPFETLGLASGAIRGLRIEQILILVQEIWKAQMKVFSTGLINEGVESERLRELNWARSELDYSKNPERFEHWRHEFVKPRQGKQRESDERLDMLLSRFDFVKEHLREYWLRIHESRVNPASLFGLSEGGLIVCNPLEYLPSSPLRRKINEIATIPPWSQITETFKTSVGEIKTARTAPVRMHFRLVSLQGKIIKHYFACIAPGHGFKILPDGWIELTGYHFLIPERNVSPDEEAITVVGTIRSADWSTIERTEQETGNLLLGSETMRMSAGPTFGWGAFKKIAHLVSVDFFVGNTIVGVSRQGEEDRYHLIGKILNTKNR